MTKRDPVSNSRRTALKALAAASLATPALAQAQTPNGSRIKVLRYPFEVAETGFDPAQIDRSVFAHRHRAHLRRLLRLRPPGATIQDQAVHRRWRCQKCRTISACGPSASSAEFTFRMIRLSKDEKRELVLQPTTCIRGSDSSIRGGSRQRSRPSLSFNILGMAPLREAALKGKQPFNYDTQVEGLRALDRYTVQFRVGEPQPRLLQTLAGGRPLRSGGARSRRSVRRHDFGAPGRHRPVPTCRVAPLVAHRAGTESDLSRG